MPGHYDTTDPYSIESTQSNQNYGSSSKGDMQKKQGNSYDNNTNSDNPKHHANEFAGTTSSNPTHHANEFAGLHNNISTHHANEFSGLTSDNNFSGNNFNNNSNSDKNSGFVNSNDNINTDNNYKNPNEETRQAGLDYIESTTGETALDYFTTRNDITNYNNEHNFGDAEIDLDNAEVRKLWNDVKKVLGDTPMTKKAMINTLNQFEKEGRKTFGTGLRGDARWTGYVGTREDYTNKLDIMAGNYDPQSTIGKYQRALINANKPLRGTTGDSIGKALLSIIGGPIGIGVTVGKGIFDSLMPEKTELPSDGIFVFEMDGDYINVNDETSELFSEFDMRTLDQSYQKDLNQHDASQNQWENTNTNTNINIDSPGSQYGLWIGTAGGTTQGGDIVDTDGDGIDDRWQTGPGQPSQQQRAGGDSTEDESALNDAYPWWPWDIYINNTTTTT